MININSYLKKIKKHLILRNVIIIASFMLLAILSEILIIHAHFMTGAQDIQFQWQRILELKGAIAKGNWLPQFAINQFNGVGSAVMTFYPYLTLIPIVLLSFVIKSNLDLIFLYIILVTFATMLIAFYSSKSISKNSKISYLFAVIYGLSVTHTSYYFNNFDQGTFLTLCVLPLVIFGFIEFIRKNVWLEMTIGIILIIFSHVLNSVFIFVLLFIWLLININKFNKIKIINLFKSLISVFCTTAIFWIPALYFGINNKIVKPITFPLEGSSLLGIFNGALNNSITYNLNVFDIIAGIVFALLFYKKFDQTTKHMYWISMIILIMCSKLFPWHLFQASLSIIQFPWRLFIFSELMLDYIFAECLIRYIKKVHLRHKLFILGLLCAVLLSCTSQDKIISKYKPYQSVTTYSSLPTQNNQFAFKLSKSNQFHNISHNGSANDYYLKKSQVLEQRLLTTTKGLYDTNKTLQFNYCKNGKFTFTNPNKKSINELNLPFMDYKGEPYTIYLNHHKISSHANQTRFLTINNIKPGAHSIKIVPGVNGITKFSRWISLIGLLLYLFYSVKRLKDKFI